eukprot:COSAG02_NODE_9_length_59728_cov_36.104714_31_plen_91_part_00
MVGFKAPTHIENYAFGHGVARLQLMLSGQSYLRAPVGMHEDFTWCPRYDPYIHMDYLSHVMDYLSHVPFADYGPGGLVSACREEAKADAE